MSEVKSGIILSCVGGRYTVLSEGLRYSCYAKGSLRHEGIKPVCGDHVLFTGGMSAPDDGTPLPPSRENDGYLLKVADRKSVLRRPPIANIDRLFIFLTVADPEPDLLYIDRLTVCANAAGIEPIIFCNKADLAPQTAEKMVSIYQKAGFRAYALSARMDDSLNTDLLKELLHQKITAVAGVSGAGKTTFFNRLFPNETGEVGSLSQKIGRGKNTTRTTCLYSLKRSTLKIDGLFADTAGFSRLELIAEDGITSADLPALFPDFSPYLGTCLYTKCSHRTEDGCAILKAIDDGEISQSRHKSFVQLREELS